MATLGAQNLVQRLEVGIQRTIDVLKIMPFSSLVSGSQPSAVWVRVSQIVPTFELL